MNEIPLSNSGPVSMFVAGLPKVELHLHLDGCLEPGLKLKLAHRNGISLAEQTEAQVRESYHKHNDLPSFLAVHYSNIDVLQTQQDFTDLAFHYFTTAAAQNVRHTEVFFDPQLHTRRGIPFETVILGFEKAIRKAEQELGLTTRLIMCFLRDLGASAAEETLQEALPFRQLIAGVGLDSDEQGHPPREFTQVFRAARNAGFLLTMHCDVDQQNSAEHIRQVLQEIRVDRVDHGLNILERDDLVNQAQALGIGFTVCPLPYGTHRVGITPELRRIKSMLDRGLLVSIGSDDPPYFGGYLSDNLQALLNHGFSPESIVQTQRNAVQTAWISTQRRTELLAEIDAYLASSPPPAP